MHSVQQGTQIQYRNGKSGRHSDRYFENGRVPRNLKEAKDRLAKILNDCENTRGLLSRDSGDGQRRQRRLNFLKHAEKEISELNKWIKNAEARPAPMGTHDMILALLKRLGEEDKANPLSERKQKVHEVLAEYAAFA